MTEALIDHPYRRAIMDEVHARPVEIVDGPARIRRLIFVMPPEAGAMTAVFQQFTAFCAAAGVAVPSDRQHSFDIGARHITWEFHTEFVTVTWRSALTDKTNFPDGIGIDILADSFLLGAVRIDVTGDETLPERLLAGFAQASLCLTNIDNGTAQVMTDFVPDADKFIRYEFAGGQLSALRRSILTRRLLEVETYRIMALLGLPLARELSPALRAAEIELGELVESLSDAESLEAVKAALATLHALSVRSGQFSERLGYRFAASHAYGDILRARLAGLRETPTGLGSSLSHGVGNRVDPGLATCSAMEKRLNVLAQKIERATAMLNVRISLDMQVQNSTVLDTIAQTAVSQFRLQRTVEGLSTIAISYYLLGILSYFLAGPLEELHLPKTLTLSAAVPFVLLGVWLMVRYIRNAHFPTKS